MVEHFKEIIKLHAPEIHENQVTDMAIQLNQCVDGTISQLKKKRKLSPKDLESQEILEALQFEDFKITIFGNGALEPYFFILNASGYLILKIGLIY
jgi:hypothetical protein